MGVWDPELGKVRFLGINALPFGAVGSVSSFLRISMAIWYIGIRGLRLCWTSFFDDYTLLSRRSNSNSASVSAECLFQLLGVNYAKEGKKAVGWGTKVKTLGVVLDLSPLPDELCGRRFVTIGHTEMRIKELTETIDAILKAGQMSGKDAEKLRGRLQWFETFAHGRVAQQSLRIISGLTTSGKEKQFLGMKEKGALGFLRNRVLAAPPTRVMAANLNTWIIFTDGACEGESEKLGSMGALLISPSGTAVEYFSEKVSEDWVKQFLEESKHPVFELELLPVWAAIVVWETYLKYSQCVFYLDNEASRGALIHGATPSRNGSTLVRCFTAKEMQCQLKVWFARVPTSSNPADKPSRTDVTELNALGINRVQVHSEHLMEQFRKIRSEE